MSIFHSTFHCFYYFLYFVLETCKTKGAVLSQILYKEIEQEINLRKEDLNLIEKNIFLIRQKLTHMKQIVTADHYHQKSVKVSY